MNECELCHSKDKKKHYLVECLYRDIDAGLVEPGPYFTEVPSE